MACLDDLPVELIFSICCVLDPDSLKSLSLVSKRLSSVVMDENAWRGAFLHKFGGITEFSSTSLTWRHEYTKRTQYLRRMQRARGRNLLYDAKIGYISHLAWYESESTVLAASRQNGLGSLSNTSTGKVRKALVYPGPHHRASMDLSAMKIWQDSIMYGFNTGVVAYCCSRIGSELIYLESRHFAPVSSFAISIAKDTRSQSLFTSDQGGTLKCFDMHSKRCILTTKVCDSSIIGLDVNAEHDTVFVLDSGGSIYLLDARVPTIGIIHHKIHRNGPVPYRALCMRYDGPGNRLLLQRDSTISILDLSKLPLKDIPVQHSLPGDVTLLEIDSSEREIRIECPGKSGRLACVADDAGNIAIFNCRSQRDCIPFHYIHTHRARITTLALNLYVVAVGFEDGSVEVSSLLPSNDTGTRVIQQSIPGYQRIAATDPLRFGVAAIRLSNSEPCGIIATGGHVRAFHWHLRSEDRLRSTMKAGDYSGPRTKAANSRSVLQERIHNDMAEIEQARRNEDIQQRRIVRAHGELAQVLTDAELLQYASFLSQEGVDSQTPQAQCDSTTSDTFEEDRDLALALSLSLL